MNPRQDLTNIWGGRYLSVKCADVHFMDSNSTTRKEMTAELLVGHSQKEFIEFMGKLNFEEYSLQQFLLIYIK